MLAIAPTLACVAPPESAPVVTAAEQPSPRAPAQAAAECSLVGAQAAYRCTEVIGYSQTRNWWGAAATPWFEGSPGIDGSRWQLRWHNGAVLEKWADPAYEGWNLGAPATHLDSPCSDATVERVVLNLGSELLDELSPAEDWAAAIDATVDTVRSKFPALRTIVLQPIVGGTAAALCNTQASRSHPVQVQAAALAADGAQVIAGPDLQVTSCLAFADALGHLTHEGSRRTGPKVAACYAQ